MPPAPTTTPALQHPPESAAINLEEEGTGVGWYIPRPALCRNDTTCTCSATTERSIQTVSEWLSPTPSSNTSTQSGSSGSLLLTAANLAGLRLEPRKDIDACSIASSTHFTMVNFGNTKVKEKKQSCCVKHHISAIVITVCALFLVGLSAAIYYIDMRTRSVRYSR